MRQWKSHKVVEAEKIKRVGYDLHGEGQGWVLEFENGEHENVDFDTWHRLHSMAKKAGSLDSDGYGSPAGGYLVRYPGDGYLSWSPAEPFEHGYQSLEEAEKVGAHRIAVERGRQIAQEGYSLEHDDQHGLGELLLEAIRFAISAYLEANDVSPETSAYLQTLIFRELDRMVSGSTYPEPLCRLKEGQPERNLEIAGALIAAELDRLTRRRQELEAAQKATLVDDRDAIPW